MADQGEQYEKSWILHHILDRFIGSREMVAVRRRMTILRDNLHNFGNHGIEWFFTGSLAEGLDMVSSDRDIMLVDTTVIVTCPFHDSNNPSDSTDRTVVVMKEADNRPGYVTLELVNPEQAHSESIILSIVPVGDVLNISGVHTQSLAETFSSSMVETLKTVCSFPYTKWPREANEWVNRPRLHGWPEKALRDEIVQGGCYLVHVGDISSPDTFLQWRISFTTAERKLIHSLSHTQFLIYGLLKYILKQISDRFKQQMGEADVLSSYIITTVIFHAVENTPGSLWQERNTFVCFLLCLKILIGWVHAGHCPNYFINGNNMFNGKVHGENQQKLLSILTELHDMKWGCLSVGSVIRPTIGDRMHRVMNGAWGYPLLSPTNSEMKSDMKIFIEAFAIAMVCTPYVALALLSKSKEDIDEFVAYLTTVHALAFTGIYTLEKHIFAKGNKEKYKHFRKSKILMTPFSLVCTSPGLMTLATYHYQTGNYTKALEMCGHMISSFKICVCELRYVKNKLTTRYEHMYCGHGYTLLHKCQEVCVSLVEFPRNGLQFCPSQLHPELTSTDSDEVLSIPPLPYAVFLTFLCYHELGDTRRRDAALIHLRAVKYEEEQGGGKHWIVHNLLGICYEMVGDTRRALREYRDSLCVLDQSSNPARKRIEGLQYSQ